jgi:putative transcriptional regulator
VEAQNPASATSHPSGPRLHFADDLLLEHTVGAASEGATLAVACHLALCGVCRDTAADLDRIGESLLAAQPASPRPEVLTRVLAHVDEGARPPAPRRERGLPAVLEGKVPPVPPALVSALAALPDPRWKWLAPGISAIVLHEEDRAVARLIRLRPGLVIPIHDHGASEHTVVFAGGLDDEHVQLGAGDALTMEPGDRHEQTAAPGGDCYALIVSEAPPRPLTWRGRILKRIARL